MLVFNALILSGCGGGVADAAKNKALTSISVTPARPGIVQGGTQQFTATGIYSDNTTADVTEHAIWTSSDTSKATITNTGMATGS